MPLKKLLLFFCLFSFLHGVDVVVSVPPYLYFVEVLSGKQLTAISLAPEGSNPHLYDPSPKQILEAKQARLWIRLSEHFEQKVAKALSHNDLIVLNLVETISLPATTENKSCSCGERHGETRDLHIWMSLELAKIQAKKIAQAMEQAFPEHASTIAVNLQKLLDDIEKTNRKCLGMLKPFQGEAILVSHPAFGYLCHDYHLKQLSIEVEGKDPLPKQLSQLIESAKTEKIRTVLTQAQYNNQGAELLAKKLDLPIHEVDPYSSNYLSNFEAIVQCIVSP